MYFLRYDYDDIWKMIPSLKCIRKHYVYISIIENFVRKLFLENKNLYGQKLISNNEFVCFMECNKTWFHQIQGQSICETHSGKLFGDSGQDFNYQ